MSKTNEYLNRLEVDGEDEYIDHWDTGELLFLASSVLRSDRNWVSVTRSIKPFGEQTRPADWYTPKNCALQYTKLLNEIEEDSKKKTLPRTERETSEVMLVKNLTDKRLTELAWLNQQTKVTSNVLKTYIEMVETGDFDEHLDELWKNIEEKEKTEVENYNEYLLRRENLNITKKLNKSRITKGKAVARVMDVKKKMSPFGDSSDEPSHTATVEEVIKNIKRELKTEEEAASTKPLTVKHEMDAPITLNALLDSKVTIPTSIAPTSPLLTSLLRSIGSSTPSSHTLSSSNAHLKDPDSIKKEPDSFSSKLREISPRQDLAQSPRPTPASSPLLNSLLKNSPSSSSPLQMSPGKDISPKAVSSPQPFFNPSSMLANAAAQQIALATSATKFFQQQDNSDGCKANVQLSPATSACLSAPTLSKLLEMPPSTPGRLPPLPVPDVPIASSSLLTSESAQTPPKSIIPKEEPRAAHPSPKKPILKSVLDSSFPTDTSVLQKSLASYSHLDKKNLSVSPSVPKVEPVEEKPTFQFKSEVLDTAHENIDILDAVCESINQAFENKEIKKEIINDDFEEKDIHQMCSISPMQSSIKVETEAMEEDASSCISRDDSSEDITVKTSPLADFLSPEQLISRLSETSPIKVDLSLEESLDDKAMSNRKFYRSKTPSKKDDSLDKSDSNSLFQSPKKTVPSILEIESPSPTFTMDNFSPVLSSDLSDLVGENEDFKVSKNTDSKSPASKKPRLLERSPADLSEDESPSIRRSGRRGKKGRGRIARSTPLKQAEPKDQYEFTESTEENSVGYQTSNTLCYMPRLKDDSRCEESKPKSTQDSEEGTSNVISPTEKKAATPVRAKQSRGGSHVNVARRSLFMSDEERVSDSIISDDASSHLLSEDKLKKWDESCDMKNPANSKLADALKKKPTPTKKIYSGKTLPTPKKDKNSSNIDMEDLSMGSRDSEEILQEKDSTVEKDSILSVSVDMEVETNDSHLSSIAAESDKQMDDVEGSESFQGSLQNEFSPPPPSEGKEEKDATQFGKQDWLHGVSPKSSELVSQSSEDSEDYESDNWDNHSASTNKSASHSAGTQPRMRRKERETTQYKAWKKAISIVLREASCHKNANVFLQKVTNDVAPGYLSIVHKPMDLSLIKKNIDTGVIRTTDQFHRDMLLMFQNAIMYNNSDHDVHQMAVEMQRDVIQQIAAFLTTQSNNKGEASEPASSLRGARTAKSQKGLGKESIRSISGKTKEEND